MQKLREVEEAKALLMMAAEKWSIWRWLFEKKKVRATADAGTAALDEMEKKVKADWSADLKRAYRELEAAADGEPARRRPSGRGSAGVDPKIKAAIEKVFAADKIAYDARMDAEATFELAERRLSVDTAREGARKAVEAYDLREKAIRRAEAAGRVDVS